MPPFTRPDALVLAAGGILGEAWMSGVLAGAEDAAGLDFRTCDAFVGTSAGSIVAARLAAGERPRRPRGADAGAGADAGYVEAAEGLEGGQAAAAEGLEGGEAAASGGEGSGGEGAQRAASGGEGSGGEGAQRAASGGEGAQRAASGGEGPQRAASGGEGPQRAASGGDGSGHAGPDARGVASGGVLRGIARGAIRVGALASAPLAPAALAVGTPAAARVRALALARAPDRGRSLGPLRGEIARLGARFDGRLRVCTVDKATGRRVVFGGPGAPRAEVADAVVASCSIPWVFRPVRIGGRSYVDGGAWSLTNLDVAPVGREAEVLCLNPSASFGLAIASPFGVVRAAAGAAAELEAFALRGRGVRVRVVGPDADAAAVMGANFMDPGPAQAVHEAGYRQGRALVTPA